MSRPRKRLPKVVRKAIAPPKFRYYGDYDADDHKISINSVFSQREQFKTLVHELVHIALPDAKEKEVVRITNKIFPVLWKQGYRRILQ